MKTVLGIFASLIFSFTIMGCGDAGAERDEDANKKAEEQYQSEDYEKQMGGGTE